MNKRNHAVQLGQSVVELLIAIAVASMVLPALLTGMVSSREGKAQQRQRVDAVALVKETQEALRVVREAGWVNFAVDGTFHPQITGSTWTLASGSEAINGYTRSVTIADAYRDATGKIVTSGGTLDPSTKLVTVTVSWTTPHASQVSFTAYMTRYLDNLTWTQTTVADFNTGTKTNTIVTNNSGGEVTLGSGGQSSWCTPNLSIAAVDLPKNGVANAVSAIQGNVFAGTGNNASGVSFANVLIDQQSPPAATIAGTFSNYKTNGIFGETNYAYVATDTNSKEIIVISLTTNPYSEVGYFDAPGVDDATSISVSGNVGYTTTGSTLYTFDLTSKSGSRPQEGSVGLAGTGAKAVVVGNYAYVATSSTTSQLQIVDVSNPNSLSVVGQAQLAGAGATDLFVNQTGTRAYVATGVSGSSNNMFIVDVSTKTGNRPTVGSYYAGGMNPKGVTVVPGNKAILVGTSGETYQVIDISNEASPSHCGGLTIASGVNGVSSVLEADGDAFSYIITGDASSELKIIEGGPGGAFATQGSFESQTFDAGHDTAFNRFVVTSTVPAQSTLTYRVGVAHAVSGSCSGVTFSFVGPDGTTGTTFSGDGVIPLNSNSGAGYANPGRCLRFRAYFNTQEPLNDPVLQDITFNYSP